MGPWNPKKLEKTGRFWPDQTFKDLLVVGLILVGLICLSAFVRAPISGPADPLDNSYTPKPEWNFLFLYEALKAFKGSWEWMGTTAIPMLLVLLLFAVPFIDRNEKRNPLRRPIAMLSGFMFVAVILVLTFIGHYSNSGANAPAPAPAAPAPTNQVATPEVSVPSPAKPETTPPISTNAPAATATNQVAAPEASAASPAAPEIAPPVSTNAPARASAAPASTNQVATPEASAPSPAASKQNVIPSQTNAVAANTSESTNQSPTYLRDVQPIFATSCASCHNPQSKIHNWLDYKAAFAERWEIRLRVWDSWKGRYYKEAMPAPNSPESLAFTDEERVTIRNWVANGAVRGVAPAPAPAAPAPTNQVAGSATSAASPATPESSQPNTTAPTTDSQEGSGLFVSVGCVACHKIEGKGGVAGPDLSHEAKLGRSSQWLITQITDPRMHVPTTIMPAHKNLTQPQLKSLADFILNPSSSPAAAGAGTESNTEKKASASSSTPAQEKGSTASTSPSSTPPAADAQAASVTVVKMIGDPRHGAVLFALDCAKCHGKAGVGNVPNPGSQAGVVSQLAPIARGLFSDDPVVFAENIDRFIQYGVTPPGPAPALQMPGFGATRALTLPEIANIEAYVLSLNGVDAAKIIHPGIAPLRFVEGTVALFGLALLAIGGLWIQSRASLPAQTGGHPAPEDFQALELEVADLKDKLEKMETRNPKDSSGSIDPQP